MPNLKFLLFTFFSVAFFCQSQIVLESESDKKNLTETDTVEGNTFYFHISRLSSFRKFEDLSAYSSYSKRLNEKSIITGGFEIGSELVLSDNFYLTIGGRFFSGGEQYQYNDSLTDSTFSYVNKYRQIGVPLKLNFEFGKKLKPFMFAGITPSSILGKQVKSVYTNQLGKEIENDSEFTNDYISPFQLVGSVGLGLKYQFPTFGMYTFYAYQKHFTETYSGLFYSHKMINSSINLGFNIRF